MLAKEASNFSANLDAKLVKTSAADAAVSLLIPADDTPEPELSIVVPALNEEVTVGQFVEWCRQGISKAGIRAEIIIVDSSSDRTPEIALAAGARVLRCPKRGLGRAYIDAIPFIRGRFVILGDADCTYDFRELRPFLAEFRRGAEFIMGSRFKGTIEEGAMPPLHRYFGTPFTTWILNVMYGTKFSDIHCGMRGITLDAFKRIELSSQGWEYASEMVLKSVHLRLNSAEVPVAFFKDPAGRTSHLVRAGWTAPWKAGWSNLKAMFIFGADCFLMLPGIVLLVASLPLMLALSAGPIYIGEFGASLNTMQTACIEVAPIDIGDFQLATMRGPNLTGITHNIVVIEIKTSDGPIRTGYLRLFLDRGRLIGSVEGNHAIPFRIGHFVNKDRRALPALRRAAEQFGKRVAVKNVVAENQGAAVVADKVAADDECLCQAFGPRLRGVAD